MKSFKGLVLALVVLGLLLLIATPVLAVDNPTSITIPITGSHIPVRVFQNLWETGDQLYVMEYDVAYTTEPTENPSETFLMAIYDGSTLRATRPLNYYQHNLISIYLDSTQALTWGSGYIIRVMGNPAYFSTLTEDVNMQSWYLSGSDWIADGTLTSKELLGVWVLDTAEVLQDDWGVGFELLTSAGRLNTGLGTSTFDDAIPGLQSILPNIYSVSSSEQEFTRATPSTWQYQTTTRARLGNRLTSASSGLSQWMFGSSSYGFVVLGAGFFFIYMLVAGRVFLATGNPVAATALSLPFIMAGAYLGFIPLVVLWVVATIVVVLFGVTFILARF